MNAHHTELTVEEGSKSHWIARVSLKAFVVFWTVFAVALVKVAALLAGAYEGQSMTAMLQVTLAETFVIGVITCLVVYTGFRSTEKLGDQLQLRKPHDLNPIDGVHPREIQRLVDAINVLITTQQESIDRQRKFLADASHQLRTPFAVLKVQIQGMLSQELDPKATLPKMLSTVDKSSDLLRQLLAVEKVEQLRRAESWTAVEIESVVRNVVLEMSPILARKHLDFSLDAVEVVVETDPWLLAELVKNLLSNAIHHSTKGGSLGVMVRDLPSTYELIVWDNGGGVSSEIRAHLFEPFTSASGAHGVGLGLSICRRIASSMNAEIGLYNRVDNGRVIGADAVVRWPKSTLGMQPSEASSLDKYLKNDHEPRSKFWSGINQKTNTGANTHE